MAAFRYREGRQWVDCGVDGPLCGTPLNFWVSTKPDTLACLEPTPPITVPGKPCRILIIYTAMATEYVLGLIPGEVISAAAKTLPDAQTDTEAFREATIDLPGRFRATIRFERFQFKRGKATRWFWTPHSAKRLE
jgi:hypothetical protein